MTPNDGIPKSGFGNFSVENRKNPARPYHLRPGPKTIRQLTRIQFENWESTLPGEMAKELGCCGEFLDHCMTVHKRLT